MNALEREIIEKFHQLQPAAKQRVRAVIDQEVIAAVSSTEFDYRAWFRKMEALREEIVSSRGNAHPPLDVVGMLRDMRDGMGQTP